MTTVQTRLQFNVRKKRLHGSKLNPGKENAVCGNKRSSALNACVEHGRKFYENKQQSKCKDYLPKQIVLLDDGSDGDSEIEGIAVKHYVNKAVGKKAQYTENIQIINTDDKPISLCITFLRIHIFISFKCVKSISTDQLVCEDQVCVLQILVLFNDICFNYEDYMLMNGSMIINNEQKKILKEVVVLLIKVVSQHLSKTTKSMQNLRIAGLHKAGVLTHP